MDSIILQTGDTTVTDGDVIGRLGFAASSETGTNARLVVAKIEAVAEESFDASNNATEMVFSLAADGAASSKMILTSAGNLNIGGELQTTNIGYTDGDNSMTIADGGKVTFAAGFAVGSDAAGDILYHNGTSYVRLGIGSDGQVLTVNDAGNAPQWEAAAGGGGVSGDTFATDLKIGRDSQNLIDFATTDNKIILRANNVDQVSLIDNVFGPEADSDVDLGTTAKRWKDAYVDSLTTTGDVTCGGEVNTAKVSYTDGDDAITIADGGAVTFAKSINQAPNTATDGGIVDIDCSTSNYHEILMNADATRINFTNVTAGQRVIVRFQQHSSHIDLNSSEGFNDVDVNGSNATIKWAGGVVPTLTESNNAVDVYGFIFESTVTNVMAFIIGQNIS